MTPNEDGTFSTVNFSGHFHGFSLGVSVFGATTSTEIFTDNYETSDVTRIAGDGIWLSGTAVFNDSGVSAGGYQFGELSGTNTNPSDIYGWDLGVDLLVGGISLDGEAYNSPPDLSVNSFFESDEYTFSFSEDSFWDYIDGSDSDWNDIGNWDGISDWDGDGYDYADDWNY